MVVPSYWFLAVLARLAVCDSSRSTLALPHISTSCARLPSVSQRQWSVVLHYFAYVFAIIELLALSVNKLEFLTFLLVQCYINNTDCTNFFGTEVIWVQVGLGTWGCMWTAPVELLVSLTACFWEKSTCTRIHHQGFVTTKTSQI